MASNGDWGLGDWGLGIGDWAQSPIPNPQSPIPNPQSPYNVFNNINFLIKIIFDYLIFHYINLNYLNILISINFHLLIQFTDYNK